MKIKIKYEPHSHQKDFHTSKAKLRLLLAGIRGGKTIASVIEGTKIAFDGWKTFNTPNVGCFVAPCYDDKTEVLTYNGWKLFRELDKNDKIATLKDNKELEYHKPKKILDYPYNGELIGLKNQEIDLLMTPNHRCLTKFKNYDWQIKQAKDIYGKYDWKFKKNVDEYNLEKKYNQEDLDKWEFYGYWFAEGYAQFNKKKRRNRIVLTTVNDIEYCRDLLERNKFKFYEYKRKNGGINFVFYDNKFSKELQSYGKALTKKVPKFIKDQPRELLKRFLHGFIVGDGHYKKTKHGQTQMWTMSKDLANDLQEMVFKCGYSCNMSRHKNKIYYMCIRTPKKHTPKTVKKHWYKKQYNGRVYCVEVENGIIYVRRNGKGVWCGNTYSMLRDVVLVEFKKFVPEKLIKDFNKSEMRAELINGSKILFRSGDQPDRLRGLKLHWYGYDECAMGKKEVHDILIGRISDTQGCGWYTTTPKGYNWVYKELYEPWENGDKTIDVIQFRSIDNPYYPKKEFELLKQKYTKEFFMQELEAKFVLYSGLVYKDFSRITHTVETIPYSKIKYYIAGVDWGYTNPSVILVIGIDGDDNAYIVDEYYETNKVIDEIVKVASRLKDKYNIETFYCDPSEPAYIDQFKQNSLNAKEGDNSVRAGINKVTEYLRLEKLKVLDKCKNTIKEFETYSYPEEKEDRQPEEEPIKMSDHTQDSLRYALMSGGQQQILVEVM